MRRRRSPGSGLTLSGPAIPPAVARRMTPETLSSRWDFEGLHVSSTVFGQGVWTLEVVLIERDLGPQVRAPWSPQGLPVSERSVLRSTTDIEPIRTVGTLGSSCHAYITLEERKIAHRKLTNRRFRNRLRP